MDENITEQSFQAPIDERDVLFGIINRYLGFHTLEAQRSTINDTSREYPFVPMDTRQLFEQIGFVADFLRTKRGRGAADCSFLDIGCGTGNVLVIAEQFDFEVFGFEKDEHPVRIARRFIGEDRVTQEDIWSFAGYDRFDVVYYFCPFSDGQSQRRFEEMVEDRMHQGAILIANQKRSEKIADDRRFQRINSKYQIWEKVGG